jgi:hypothetical protein
MKPRDAHAESPRDLFDLEQLGVVFKEAYPELTFINDGIEGEAQAQR